MRARFRPDVDKPPVADPCRHLAARVIDQALKDVLQQGGTPTHRDSARRFLAGSAMLRYWCDIARLDSRWVTRMAANLELANVEARGTRWTHGNREARNARRPPS